MLRPPASACAAPRLATNAASCVVRVALGRHRLLLTGDLPAAREAELAAGRAGLEVDWLSVPHHGSRTSSSEALLDAARPAWASVQAGYRHRFGHPDPQVIGRYLARRVHVVRSDESGMAQWRFAGDGAVDLHRWRASAHRDWDNRPSSGAPSGEGPAEEGAAPDAGGLLSKPASPF